MFSNTQESAEYKLILLYIFNQFSIPLTNTQVMDFVLEKDYMNYSFLQQSLGELASSGMLEYSKSNEDFFYLITEKGEKTLQYFIERLNNDLRKDLEKAITIKKQIIQREMKIVADYIKENDTEYIVDLKIIENNIKLIDIKLNVISNKHAKQICKKWKLEAPYLYGDIIKLLVDED